MKKLYMLFFIVISFSSIAQTTKVFPDTMSHWVELQADTEKKSEYIAEYLIFGDTVFNGHHYKNLYLVSEDGTGYLSPFFYGPSKKIACVRKDSLKIFIRFLPLAKTAKIGVADSILTSSKEYLVVDYGWQQGDTVFSTYYTPNSNKYLIVNKRAKLIDPLIKNPCEYLTFKGGYANDLHWDNNFIIVGMGFNFSFFFRFWDFDTSNSFDASISGDGVMAHCIDNYPVYPIFYNWEIFGCQMDVSKILGTTNNIIAKNQLTAYPNPAKDYITLSGFEGEDISSIHISDIVGHKQELKYESDGEQALVDISALPQGLYFVTVYSDKTTYLCRIIKQ